MNEHHQIIKLISEGDDNAFSLLYQIFSDKVYNTALSFTKNEHDAEEVTQEVFVKVFRNASKFKFESAVNTWIYRIAVNTALSYLKKKNRKTALGLDDHARDLVEFEHPGVLLENREKSKLLFQAIDQLLENQKTAFILSFIEHLPRQEVADIMELGLKAVESLLQRAKTKLRKILEKDFEEQRKKKK